MIIDLYKRMATNKMQYNNNNNNNENDNINNYNYDNYINIIYGRRRRRHAQGTLAAGGRLIVHVTFAISAFSPACGIRTRTMLVYTNGTAVAN